MAAEPTDHFPTYAELARTQAWGGSSPRPITAPADELAAAEPGSRYTEQAVLGVGGMGKIVLAHDARIGREVAVKQLHPDRELAPDERSRFLREAQVQGQLEHPSIVPVYDIDRRADGTTFFTMRRVRGRTLHDILDDLRRGAPEAVARYTQRELLQAFSTVCLAVDYAHSRGVIHRDLKPANIMLGDFGEVYVLDWGLARLLEPRDDGEPRRRLSEPGVALGTPLYMAPEQLGDRELAQRRELAAGHAGRARAALGRAGEPGADHEGESRVAIRELARALALDPANPDHVAMFAEIMAAPPRTTPPEVRASTGALHEDVLRSGVRYAVGGALAWYLFLPLLLVLGVRRVDYVLLVAVPISLTAVLGAVAMYQRPIRRWLLCAAVVTTLCACAGLSRVMGPLVLMPTALAALTIVLQTNPDRFVRWFSLAAGLLVLLVPVGLELAGITPRSYVFEGGQLIALPQMIELPRLGTFAFHTLANAATMLVPALFVARVRSELSRAQRRELLQAWQLRRLPVELMRANPLVNE